MSALSFPIQFLVAASNPSQRIKQAFERIKAWSAKDTAQGSSLRYCPDRNRAESELLCDQALSHEDISRIVNRLRRLSGSPEGNRA